MKKVNIGLLMGLAVLMSVGLILLATFGAFGGAGKYGSFDQAMKSGEKMHVVGKWVNRTNADYDVTQELFAFDLQDTTGNTQRVHFYDPKPGDLEDAERIVIEGRYHKEHKSFVADKIFMKCPSKYNDENAFEGVETASM